MSPRTGLAFAALGLALVLGYPLRAVEKSSDDRRRIEFTSKEGNFKAVFPSRPIEKEFSAGSNLTIHMTLAMSGGGMYMIGYADAPAKVKYESEDDIQKRLDAGRDGALRFTGCGLVKEERIRLEKKYPGRDFTGEVPNHIQARCRMYFVNGRIYQLLVAGNRSFVESEDAKAFMASFWLLK